MHLSRSLTGAGAGRGGAPGFPGGGGMKGMQAEHGRSRVVTTAETQAGRVGADGVDVNPAGGRGDMPPGRATASFFHDLVRVQRPWMLACNNSYHIRPEGQKSNEKANMENDEMPYQVY